MALGSRAAGEFGANQRDEEVNSAVESSVVLPKPLHNEGCALGHDPDAVVDRRTPDRGKSRVERRVPACSPRNDITGFCASWQLRNWVHF